MPAQPSAIFPVSPAQEALWVLEQLVPGTAAYHIPVALRLLGTLDRAALGRALSAVAARHEILRTSFAEVENQAVQLVADAVEITVAEVDLSATPEDLDARLEAEAARPFDLAAAPLLRATSFRLAGDEQVLLITVHHLAADMWSLGLLIAELSAAYAAETGGEPVAADELPLQYGDFAVWQHEQLTDAAVETLAAHWRERLAGAPGLLEIPADRPRPAVLSFRGDILPVTLPAATSAKVAELAQRRGASPFMVLLAAFQAVLARHTGGEDIVVGTPVSTREADTEDLIGCFVNTVPLRTSLAGDPSFGELVDRVREVTLDGVQHRDLPFPKLVEQLRVPRDLSYNPVVQAMFVLQNAPLPTPELAGLSVTPVHVSRGASQLDLDLQLWHDGERFEGFVEYSTDLFEAATIGRLWDHLTVLLSAALDDPDTRLSRLPLLTAAEEERAVVAWNDTAAPGPDGCLHELVERQAGRTPDADAVLWSGGRLSYRELDARADAVAARLRELGVGRDVLVGVCATRSPAMVAALLGVLKAGGAYLPLDPGYPADRLEYMITDARPLVVLTDDTSVTLPEGTPVLPLSEITGSAAAVASVTRPGDPAYVIYTSGSTGRPKGVAVHHAGVVNTLAHLTAAHGIGPGDRMANVSPISFDLSVFELFGALTSGAAVVLPDAGRATDPAHWRELLTAFGLTVWGSAPALLDALVGELEREAATHPLRLAVVAGDVLPLGVPGRAAGVFPGLTMLNYGGPTETTIYSIGAPVDVVDPQWTSIPYGRPLPNTRALILDDRLRLVPVGVPGQLYHGGTGIARGYLGRPALTAERFLPDPYAGDGSRLYASGDLARYREDGQVELLGRIDHQVKIRGFRIELGEVGVVLDRHPAIAESVVVAAPDPAGPEKRLVAYYVPAGAGEPPVAELRAHLERTLPDYMVPAVFVPLAALPLSPNGKVDRKALPDAGTERPSLGVEFVAPRDPVEEFICGVWHDVLAVDTIGVHDHFFELGGQSLHATQVVSLLRENLRVDVPLRTVFDAPTVARQADAVRELGAGIDVAAVAETALRVAEMTDEEVLALLAAGERA
ncbi:non-ribosomal peptide synthetase [Amycolatopsis australiensis]|uniref:Amino acid adenylation domain-containing protein n=1 Tax=Amycolatopsis australiensis TaxID=546364 RepID=A0A1K1RMD0_9PSEU|nr:non-ribosomal peptide synthetase [Amycolatopsis australiensis]SFW73005.1 amino acid adenylation domain-containing protein [Amycolatopsis australiensis]